MDGTFTRLPQPDEFNLRNYISCSSCRQTKLQIVNSGFQCRAPAAGLSTLSRGSGFGQKGLDFGLEGGVVGVACDILTARMDETDQSFPINEKSHRGPGPGPLLKPPPPQSPPVVVNRHGKFEPIFFGEVSHVFRAKGRGRFVVVEADHFEALSVVLLVKFIERRRRGRAIGTLGPGPEPDEDRFSFEVRQPKGRRVQPILDFPLGRFRAVKLLPFFSRPSGRDLRQSDKEKHIQGLR